jgi:hypothetical protein
MFTIENKNGIVYTLIGEDCEYSFLVCRQTGQFVVAWKLHEVGEGFYEWEQGHYFKDLLGACECFVKKCLQADDLREGGICNEVQSSRQYKC